MHFWDEHKTIKGYYEMKVSGVCEKYQLRQLENDILMFIYNNPAYNTAADIVRIRKSTKSHVSTSLKVSEGRGFIEKRIDKDNKKNVWVHNYTGHLWYVNVTTGNIKPFQFLSSEHIGYIDVERYSIVHDSRDIIWITTYGNGLYAYELATGDLQHFTFDIGQSSHINSNYLQYVMEDRSGGIWVSSEFSGLSHLEILNKGTQRLHPSGENSSDRSNTIRMLFQNRNGNIYMANRMGSLYEYDPGLTKTIRREDFTHNVYSMNEDSEGNLWLGMRGTGLCF